VPYVGTACPRTEWSDPDREWLEARGVHVQYRASLEQDVAAMREVRPDLAVGTTPLVQKAKELGIPALYFTNMVSARPLFGPAGAGSSPRSSQRRRAGRSASMRMVGFFEGVGTPEGAGYGLGPPRRSAGLPRAPAQAEAVRAKAEEAVGS
jgi:chlorophyllide a reductase subunit Y